MPKATNPKTLMPFSSSWTRANKLPADNGGHPVPSSPCVHAGTHMPMPPSASGLSTESCRTIAEATSRGARAHLITLTRRLAKDLGPMARSGAAAVPGYCKVSRQRHRAQRPVRWRGEVMRCALGAPGEPPVVVWRSWLLAVLGPQGRRSAGIHSPERRDVAPRESVSAQTEVRQDRPRVATLGRGTTKAENEGPGSAYVPRAYTRSR